MKNGKTNLKKVLDKVDDVIEKLEHNSTFDGFDVTAPNTPGDAGAAATHVTARKWLNSVVRYRRKLAAELAKTRKAQDAALAKLDDKIKAANKELRA